MQEVEVTATKKEQKDKKAGTIKRNRIVSECSSPTSYVCTTISNSDT